MIHNVVASIGYRLNEHVMNALSLSDEAVIISSLVDLKGNINPDIENKISMFLINIEEERTAKNGHFQSSPGMNPPPQEKFPISYHKRDSLGRLPIGLNSRTTAQRGRHLWRQFPKQT